MGVRDNWAKGVLAEELDALSLDMAGVSGKIGETTDVAADAPTSLFSGIKRILQWFTSTWTAARAAKVDAIDTNVSSVKSTVSTINSNVSYIYSNSKNDNIRYDIGTIKNAKSEVILDQELSVKSTSATGMLTYLYLGSFVPKHSGFVAVSVTVKSNGSGESGSNSILMTSYGSHSSSSSSPGNSLSGIDNTTVNNTSQYITGFYGSLKTVGTSFNVSTNIYGKETGVICSFSTGTYTTYYSIVRVSKNMPILFFAYPYNNGSATVYCNSVKVYYEEV